MGNIERVTRHTATHMGSRPLAVRWACEPQGDGSRRILLEGYQMLGGFNWPHDQQMKKVKLFAGTLAPLTEKMTRLGETFIETRLTIANGKYGGIWNAIKGQEDLMWAGGGQNLAVRAAVEHFYANNPGY